MNQLAILEGEIRDASDRAIQRLYSLNDRVEGAMSAVIDAAENHQGYAAAERLAYGHAVQREAQASMFVLLEALQTAGELVGLANALQRIESRTEAEPESEEGDAND